MPEIEQRYLDILERKYPNKKTRDNYVSRLRALVNHLETEIAEILKEPDMYYSKLQEVYPSLTTRKNVLTVLLALLREDADVAEEDKARWRTLHENLAKHQDVRVKRSEPEQKQIEQYTSFEEIEAKYEELKKDRPHRTFRSSLQFVLLSVLVHMRPKRADLGAVQIYEEKDPSRTDINYVVLRKKGTSYLSMHVYKTSKYYKTVEEDLTAGLLVDIQTSLKRWPREYLFTKENGEPMSNNTYTVFVKDTFKNMFGKATGVSMLRHIYITEKLNFDDMTMEEQDEEARLMLHTSGLQRRYKWPKKLLCPKLCADYMTAEKEQKQSRKRIKYEKEADKRRQTRKVPKKKTVSE